MTDQDPIPTTRMPVPEPPDSPTEGWPGTTAADARPVADADATPPSTPSTPSPQSSPPPSPPPTSVARPPRRDDVDRGRAASILFGVAILGLGLWFFAEHTLGYELPRIRWNQVWPAVLILIGLWVVLGSLRRGSR